MVRPQRLLVPILLAVVIASWFAAEGYGQSLCSTVIPEQHRMAIRDPAQMPRVRIPDVLAPETVASHAESRPAQPLPLDEAIRVALANSEVIRVLTGTGAVSSGSTIYDPTITNTQIDTARAAFDPVLGANNHFNQLETPVGVADGAAPHGYRIAGTKAEDYTLDFGVSKKLVTGATASVGAGLVDQRLSPVIGLNPTVETTTDVGITQPLLQGGGIAANVAPIEIARLNTERSFFQMKDSVQEMVSGVIEGYWRLVAARVVLWTREQQVRFARMTLDRAEAGLRSGVLNLGDAAQARTSLAGFEANQITAAADVLQREAALQNILGLPPVDQPHMMPVTPPSTERCEVNWEDILRTAEEYRPDLIELKLILDADRQQLVQANNTAMPQLDAVALYRWDGLQGRAPDAYWLGTEAGQYTGWTLGLNFSVPLGLRAGRAQVRQSELLLMRDRANLQQGLHSAAHSLATSYRNLARHYEQYLAYRNAREAAHQNLERQTASWRDGRTILLNVLSAINDWGNDVALEAGTLAEYNIELANLEVQTGTILEAHGIRFIEERYCSIGRLGRLFRDERYPRAMQPGPNSPQYPTSDKPSEEIFQLKDIGARTKTPASTAPETLPAPPGR